MEGSSLLSCSCQAASFSSQVTGRYIWQVGVFQVALKEKMFGFEKSGEKLFGSVTISKRVLFFFLKSRIIFKRGIFDTKYFLIPSSKKGINLASKA